MSDMCVYLVCLLRVAMRGLGLVVERPLLTFVGEPGLQRGRHDRRCRRAENQPPFDLTRPH